MVRDPMAASERIMGRIARRRDMREMQADGRDSDAVYPIDPVWLEHLHRALGSSWPCPCESEAESLYDEIMARFRADGLPERYDGWCDGGSGFTKAAWCLAVHLAPGAVVETGVARGVTSRIILEALERNASGRLSSIDLPSVDSRFHGQIAIAVPERLQSRWHLLNGTSRQLLPGLLASLGSIDLFIHDSLHTGRNTRFELDEAWRVLKPGGALLVDDVYQSLAFDSFVEAVKPAWSVVGANDDGSYRFGIILTDPDLHESLRKQIRGSRA